MTGEVAEDQSALIELEEPGTALPGAKTEQNAVADTQCRQDYLPTPDLKNNSKVLGKSSVDKRDCGDVNLNPEKNVTQEVIEEESTGERPFQKEEIPDSNTGTLKGQQTAKRAKVLEAKVITEEEIVRCCQTFCTTITENITIKIFEDGTKTIVRHPERHSNLFAFDQLMNIFKYIKMIMENCQTS